MSGEFLVLYFLIVPRRSDRVDERKTKIEALRLKNLSTEQTAQALMAWRGTKRHKTVGE